MNIDTQLLLQEIEQLKARVSTLESERGAVRSDTIVSPPTGDDDTPHDRPISPDVGRWVSVDDQLPDHGGDVIVATSYGFVGGGFYTCGWVFHSRWEEGDEITHWQPMPEAPAVATDEGGSGRRTGGVQLPGTPEGAKKRIMSNKLSEISKELQEHFEAQSERVPGCVATDCSPCILCGREWPDDSEQVRAMITRGKCIVCIVEAGERIEMNPYEFSVANDQEHPTSEL